MVTGQPRKQQVQQATNTKEAAIMDQFPDLQEIASKRQETKSKRGFEASVVAGNPRHKMDKNTLLRNEALPMCGS